MRGTLEGKYLVLAESYHDDVGLVRVYVGQTEADSPLDAPDELARKAREGEVDDPEGVLATLDGADLLVVEVGTYIAESNYTLKE